MTYYKTLYGLPTSNNGTLPVDDGTYMFIDGKSQYMFNHKIPNDEYDVRDMRGYHWSDWTELDAYEYASKHNVRILHSRKKKRELYEQDLGRQAVEAA